MDTNATLARLNHSLNHIFCILVKQPGASGYSPCFVLNLSTGMLATFHPLLCCFSPFTLVESGKMSSRSDVYAIYSMWHNLYSSIAVIDSTDTAAHLAEDEMWLIKQFKRF